MFVEYGAPILIMMNCLCTWRVVLAVRNIEEACVLYVHKVNVSGEDLSLRMLGT